MSTKDEDQDKKRRSKYSASEIKKGKRGDDE